MEVKFHSGGEEFSLVVKLVLRLKDRCFRRGDAEFRMFALQFVGYCVLDILDFYPVFDKHSKVFCTQGCCTVFGTRDQKS